MIRFTAEDAGDGTSIAVLRVKTLFLFHHDPDHDDTYMAKINKDAQEAWLGAIVSREGMALLMAHPFPGNIRELRNVIERLTPAHSGKFLFIDGRELPW